jgi:molybdenum cofactor guanylyltransferase
LTALLNLDWEAPGANDPTTAEWVCCDRTTFNFMTTDGPTTGVILAGGQARRMGGVDKGLVELAGRPLLSWILEGLEPQVDRILINANRNQDRYAQFGHPVVEDAYGHFEGPLAGFAASMRYAGNGRILTLPCDSPSPPADLAGRLADALKSRNAELAVAHDGGRLQPVYALIPVKLLESLQEFLEAGDRKIDRWYAHHRMATADFSYCPDAFLNLNRPEDMERIQAIVAT